MNEGVGTKANLKMNMWTRIRIMILIAAMLTINIPVGIGVDAAVFTNILYVDDSAAAGGDGTSWENAFNDLQSALTAAVYGDQIWVAAGEYKPTSGVDRTASFILPNGVAMYGGFVGDETSGYDISLRDWKTHGSILSGDIGVIGDISDNSYHVIQIGEHLKPVSDSSMLDGFTITAGHANGIIASVHDRGGGMVIVGDPILRNLIIDSNIADNTNSGYAPSGGGGIFLDGSPVLSNVVFINNTAIHDSSSSICGGGGLYINWGYPALNDVFFSNNRANSNGGGVFINDSDSEVFMTSVQFTHNSGHKGGGFFVGDARLAKMDRVQFISNSSSGYGGAIYMHKGSILGINTLISGNYTLSGGSFGGGISIYGGTAQFINATFTGNYASLSGGAAFNAGGSANFINTIFYGNSAGVSINEIYAATSTSVSFSNVNPSECYNVTPVSSVNEDPLFADAPNGDFHLQLESPCIDVGTNSPYESGGLAVGINMDLDGAARLVDGDGDSSSIVDMGAYEFQAADTVSPETSINTCPPYLTNSSSASFTWSGSDNVTTEANLEYSYALDGQEWSAWDVGTGVSFGTLPEGSHSFTVKARDEAGNEDATPAECTWTIDMTKPAASISTTAANPTSVSPIPVTVDFGEEVTGFAMEDIDISNGTAGDLSGSGQGYTFTVTPTASGAVSIVLPAGIVQDAAGNPNTVSNTINILYQPLVYSADLSTLSVSSGTLDPLFDPDITEYQVNVARNKKSIWITAVTEDSSAVMTINGERIISGDPYLMDLEFGENYVVIEVTPQDGAAAKTYSITITRPTDRPEKPNKPGKPK